jgi:O-antigen/teichoic acid export membrane protein
VRIVGKLRKVYYIGSLIDQGLMSIFQFLVSVLAIRFWSESDFGLYAIILAVGFMLIGIQNALINTPLSVIVSKCDEKGSEYESWVFWCVNQFFIIVVVFLCSVLFFYKSSIYLGVVFYFVGVLYREFYRNKMVVDKNVRSLLVMDFVYVLLVILIPSLLFYSGDIIVNVNEFLLLLGVGGILVTIIHNLSSFLARKDRDLKCVAKTYLNIWSGVKWSLAGVVITEIQNRGYVFIVGAFYGAKGVAILQAARLVFGPLNVLVGGWARVARPEFASMKNPYSINHLMNKSLTAFVVFNLFLGAGLFFFWEYIEKYLYDGKYEDIYFVVILWFIVNFIFNLRSVYSVVMQASEKYKEITKAVAFSSFITMAIVLIACFFVSEVYTVIGVIVGELFLLCMLRYVVVKYCYVK